ncbi:hypothetical protein KOW79_021874 [Hemibagrus wyckioides]|uniref:Uncharacterized protein n=1 Tax=Hemibagrus wyckioides TaxID=337641 RepID=A0A9D3S7X2_9TELE|nr:hypothetical protein KOW79_021874 [Hemibagrus wyckioides]
MGGLHQQKQEDVPSGALLLLLEAPGMPTHWTSREPKVVKSRLVGLFLVAQNRASYLPSRESITRVPGLVIL